MFEMNDVFFSVSLYILMKKLFDKGLTLFNVKTRKVKETNFAWSER